MTSLETATALVRAYLDSRWRNSDVALVELDQLLWRLDDLGLSREEYIDLMRDGSPVVAKRPRTREQAALLLRGWLKREQGIPNGR